MAEAKEHYRSDNKEKTASRWAVVFLKISFTLQALV